jgi:hypothetical protein
VLDEKLITRLSACTALREQASTAGALFLETLTPRNLGVNGQCAANFDTV